MDKRKESVFSYIESRRDEMLIFCGPWFASTPRSAGRNYDTICEVLAEKLRSLGCEVQVHKATEKYLKLQGAEIMG